MNVLVDPQARRSCAEIYRQFASGRMTNYEMEDARPDGREWALHDIWYRGIWPLYDDFHEHRLTFPYHLTKEDRRHIARIVLFLHGDSPYRWPRATGLRTLGDDLIALLTLGFYRPARCRWDSCGGDEDVWPFFSREEYEATLRNPTLLASPHPT